MSGGAGSAGTGSGSADTGSADILDTDVTASGPERAARKVGAWLAGPIPLSLVLAFALGAGVIAVAGSNPLSAYAAMVDGSLMGRGLATTLQRAVPIVGMALAVSVAFRAGIFNIGTEGQMVFGGLAGTVVALFCPGPGIVVCLLAMIAAVAAGGLWGVCSAVLQTSIGVPILISSLLMNYVASYVTSYFVMFPLKAQGSQTATDQVPEAVRIAPLISPRSQLGTSMSQALGKDNFLVLFTKTVNWSFVIVVLLVFAVWLWQRRTPAGFESGMAGLNPSFARYAGVPTKRMTITTMFASGGMAGLVGIMLVLGSSYRLFDKGLEATGYAWTGILVALLAANAPIAVMIAGAFFAAIVVGGEAMQRAEGVSSQIASVLQAIVIVLVAIKVRWPRRRRARANIPGAGRDDMEVGRV